MANQQQVAVKQKADTVRATLEKLKPQMAMALPKHLTPDRLLRVTMTAVQNSPKLLDCDRTSLFAAVMSCAQLGLEPDGVLGQAYLVPFGKKVQFIPGYKGLLTLARNSGEISSIQAHEVCEHDEFDYAYGLEERLHHRPAEGDRGEVTHFYAYAKFKDGGYIFEVMPRAEVDRIRDNSEGYKYALTAKAEAEANKKDAWKMKTYDANPWVAHYIPMGRKTAIRRIAKYLPLSVQRAAAFEDAYEAGKHASTDEFGDVVIDGESEVVEGEETGAASATNKLDALAGDDDSQEEVEPTKEEVAEEKADKAEEKAEEAEQEKPEAAGKSNGSKKDKAKPRYSSQNGFAVEDGQVVDQSTGEIVPEEHVKWFDDGTFSVLQGYKAEPKEEAGLFPEEG